MSNGMHSNLISQLDKLKRHNRQGSIKTRGRYYEAMRRFCRFLAERYRLEKLSNIAPKHLHGYVKLLQDAGLSPATLKTDLSAIRFWHSKISNPRHKLPDNSAFGVERRSHGKENRAWSDDEFTKMLRLTAGMGRDDYVTALTLAYYAGMRIEECFTLDTAMAEKALRTGEITFHGKNGRWRTVPVDGHVAEQLQIMLKKVRRGSKLLTPANVPVGNAIHNFQKFIERHRDEIRSPDGGAERGAAVTLTAHGLRHSYACRQYLQFREQGDDYEQACRKVSQLLGHNRPGITARYLAAMRELSINKQHLENTGIVESRKEAPPLWISESMTRKKS